MGLRLGFGGVKVDLLRELLGSLIDWLGFRDLWRGRRGRSSRGLTLEEGG
jgi:hypothetical protein